MEHRQLNPLCARIGRDRVDQVITAFYEHLRADALLAPLFAHIGDAARHERRVADFWWIAMGGQPPAYEVSVDMLGVHAGMRLRPEHFARWLALLHDSLERHLEPPLASDWLRMAEGIVLRLRTALGVC
ncbi:hypothetical protein BI364_17025 [Acidihalobacter yilgarnensis]|uniref:Globin n=1 Tax=Acidihalobacter yilgarnensis TaxID=2819280 RepID=A0A1D8ISC8_9GAMM|nr:group III truncated hemoglobin [Acidihalobacter yilgarnensis]AOU99401.1 hypothetical protein BI364_17025 [Acidihalobacter yilgarnensis]